VYLSLGDEPGLLFLRAVRVTLVWCIGMGSEETMGSRCQAYEPVARNSKGWARCGRRAERGFRFCKVHGDVLTGVLLGCLEHGPAVDEAVSLVEEVAPWNRRAAAD